ncbi:ATP-binding cassette domain-containing protein [Alicyclobacillus kakegawensis]|uniref:ATP-binding cassette domain-containing protein n=1 Tax=Alicyclobacillus kakegawensis TaxID=392012 RepID=UPI000833E3B7|nr:ATP-binding cassette domain-containing protein [Alicyclobacillus kakegawensis]
MPFTVRQLEVTTSLADRPLIQGVNLDILDGTVTLLIGRSGAGKSTLLEALSGLTPPTRGQVICDGRPLWRAGRVNPAVQRRLSLVLQSPEEYLFAPSVLGEFRYSLKPLQLPRAEEQRRITEALAQVGLHKALLSASPLTLSGGQKRRVALATAMAVQPDWLLLDEPTAGLDSAATASFCRWLRDWRAQRRAGGVIVATHDLDALLPLADAVIVLCGGRVRFSGDTASLLERPQVLAEAGMDGCELIQISSFVKEVTGEVPTPLTADNLAASLLQWRSRAPVTGGDSPGPQPTLHALDSPSGQLAPTPHAASLPSDTELIRAGLNGAGPGGATSDGTPLVHSAERRAPWRGVARRLDVRAKWACCLMLSAALLMQDRAAGCAVATLLVAGVLLAADVPRQQFWRLMKPLVVLLLVSAALSGLRWGSTAGGAWPEGMVHWGRIGFAPWQALDTLAQTYRFMLLAAVGAALPATTPPLEMRRGIERMLRPLARTGFPSEAVSLAASLILRFIPLLLGEFHRFARMARARGRGRPRGGLRLRDLPAVIIPLLLSLLRLADEFSEAMEMRGYRLGGRRTEMSPLVWRPLDTASVAVVGACSLALIGLSLWTPIPGNFLH